MFSKGFIEKVKHLGNKKFGKNSGQSSKYKEFSIKYVKGGKDIAISMDLIQKSDVRVFASLIQDLTCLRRI